jgi:hypothetical protein
MLYASIPSVFLLLGLSSLAFWRNDGIIYVISGLAWLVYGFTYWSTSNLFSIIMVIVGIAIIIRPFVHRTKEE